MTITPRVQSQYFQKDQGLIRLAPNQDRTLPTKRAGTPWTLEEHDRFLTALEQFPSGPWKTIAAHIGTRTTRQTMTHAQKYREKIARRQKAKAAVSPTTKLRTERTIPVPVVSGQSYPRTSLKSHAIKSSMAGAPAHAQYISLGTEHDAARIPSCQHSQFVAAQAGSVDGHVIELQEDDSIIALLETFEPMEMASVWDPPTNVRFGKSPQIDPQWLPDSLFQQCLPL